MRSGKPKPIPAIDPNSRLIQPDPRKLTNIKKDRPSSQRVGQRPTTGRKYIRKQNENDDYYQQEQLIEDKYHLVREISALKEEVANYNQQILQFIQKSKPESSSSLSGSSSTTISSLSSAISMLEDELSEATKERKEAAKEFSQESQYKLIEEIEKQRNKIEALSKYISSVKEKINVIHTEISSPEVQHSLTLGDEKRKHAFELSNKLQKLDDMEELLMNQVKDLAEMNSIPLTSLTALDKLTRKYQHIVYQRMVKEKEFKRELASSCKNMSASSSKEFVNDVISNIYQRARQSSPQKDNQPQIQDVKEDKETIICQDVKLPVDEPKEVKEDNKTEKNETTRIINENIRVKFDVPSDLGIPCDPPIDSQQYYFAYQDLPDYDPNDPYLMERNICRLRYGDYRFENSVNYNFHDNGMLDYIADQDADPFDPNHDSYEEYEYDSYPEEYHYSDMQYLSRPHPSPL